MSFEDNYNSMRVACMLLGFTIPYDTWDAVAPKELVDASNKASDQGYPTSIAYHPEYGWFGIGSRQGLCTWWSEIGVKRFDELANNCGRIEGNIFEYLYNRFNGRTETDFFDSIVKKYNPYDLLIYAIREFRRKGNQDRMLFAVKILRKFGKDSLMAIQNIIDSNDIEYFLELIAELSEECEYATRMLEYLTNHPSLDVKNRLFALIS
jgi:hypothetical protein